MDVNGTRMHLLLGRADWAACAAKDGTLLSAAWDIGPAPGVPSEDAAQGGPGLAWDATRAELTLAPEPFEFPATRFDQRLGRADRRGAGTDAAGNWYWIGASRQEITVFSAGDGSTARFWPPLTADPPSAPRPGSFAAADPAPATAHELSGAAVTDDSFLAVGALDLPGLLVFDLQTGGPPVALRWPAGVTFAPFDIAPRPGGGVYVLDLDSGRVWELDRHFHVLPAAAPPAPAGDFADLTSVAEATARVPTTTSAGPAAPVPITASAATRVAGTPIAVAASPGGGFLVMDADGPGGGSRLRAYASGAQTGEPTPLIGPDGELVAGHDMTVAGGVLFVGEVSGRQAFAYALELGAAGPAVTLSPAVYPMRRHGGKGLVSAGDRAYYDFDERWLPLVAQPGLRYATGATLTTPDLDSGIPGCVWHRVLIDACLPPGTGVRVWSVADDDPDALSLAEWQPEPVPAVRRSGPEVPYVDPGPYAVFELLLQAARGRHLKLRIELSGNGRATPRVRAMRVWYPRFSYLERYLPAVYREDPDAASFLDRYLANPEGMLTAIEDRIAASQVLLDPRSAPSDGLAWLAGWLALALDPAWDERRRRLFIGAAMKFYAVRGTIRAIALALRFVLDPDVDVGVFAAPDPAGPGGPRIVEAFRTRSTPAVVFGDPTRLAINRSPAPTGRWTPPDGRDALNARYADHLAAHGLAPAAYPTSDPGDATSAAWHQFSREVLGFIPRETDPTGWQGFVAARYSNPARLSRAWGIVSQPATFADVALPAVLPHDGAPLWDWFQYHGITAQMRATAHRFTVMLPWPLAIPDGSGIPRSTLDQAGLTALVRRIVELQKPAHTVFDIRFFWAAFRIGEVRLGLDTQLASSSRAAELVTPSLLGRGYLGESYLGGPPASGAVTRPAPPQTATTTIPEETA